MFAPFWGLQGINLAISFGVGSFYMSCHAACSHPPFHWGIREADTVLAWGELLYLLTAFTLLYNLMTGASIKLAPAICHEETIHTHLHTITNHCYHILSHKIKNNPRPDRNGLKNPSKRDASICLNTHNLSRENKHQIIFFKGLYANYFPFPWIWLISSFMIFISLTRHSWIIVQWLDWETFEYTFSFWYWGYLCNRVAPH